MLFGNAAYLLGGAAGMNIDDFSAWFRQYEPGLLQLILQLVYILLICRNILITIFVNIIVMSPPQVRLDILAGILNKSK